jgi:hypothetical protein
MKTDIKLEDYLKLTKKINNRQLLTKFKTSDHPLEIELGRYKKTPLKLYIDQCEAHFRNSNDCFI